MSNDTCLDLVTGAFSYSGSHIAKRLLDHVSRRPTTPAAGERRKLSVPL
jgi:hypothetical protein